MVSNKEHEETVEEMVKRVRKDIAKAKKEKKKPLKAFWKKNPELERITRHLGKAVDRLSFDDLLAISIGIWGAAHLNKWQGFILGATGYKMATSANIISAAAGIGMLGFTGIIGFSSHPSASILTASTLVKHIPVLRP